MAAGLGAFDLCSARMGCMGAESVCAVKRGGAAGSPKMLNGLGHGERPA
jgi:hypothetical protein